MEILYTKKIGNTKIPKKKEENINQIEKSINSIQSLRANKFPNDYKNNDNINLINDNNNNNYITYFIDRDKDKDSFKNKNDENDLKQNDDSESFPTLPVGISNKEFNNNNNYNYNTINSPEFINIKFLNLKDIHNFDNNNIDDDGGKLSINSSNRKFSENSSLSNRHSSFINQKRKYNIFTYGNNSNPINNQNNLKTNSVYIKDIVKPLLPGYIKNNIKNRLSDYILKNQNKTYYVNSKIKKKRNESNNIQMKKTLGINYINSLKNKKNFSENKDKKKISPIDYILVEKNKKNRQENFGNPINIKDIGNYYNYWSDNEGHMGGKINLSLNNKYGNKVNYDSSLFFIIKIQSLWKGYNLRKNLLNKIRKNSKFNIFYKQKLFITTLFYILNINLRKELNNNFELFKQKIKNCKNYKKGYDINSSFLNSISNCYQNFNKDKNNSNNLLLYNKKRLSQPKNLKYITEFKSPKIIKEKNYYENNLIISNDFNGYNTSKINHLSYTGKKEKEDEKEINKISNKKSVGYKKYLYPNSISNIHKNTKKYSFNNDDINLNKNKDKNYFNNDNKGNTLTINKLNKYKKYIFFLFLLCNKIEKASHRFIFKELIYKLNEKKINNMKEIKKNKLLKIIKNNERKKMKYYYKIFTVKVLTEKIKDIILNKNNNLKLNSFRDKDKKKFRNKFMKYFKLAIKQYFCNENEKPLKIKKEYEIGKYMFLWYRKTFY